MKEQDPSLAAHCAWRPDDAGEQMPWSSLAVFDRGAVARRGCEGYMVPGGPPSGDRGHLWVEAPRRAEVLDHTPPGYSGWE